MRNNQSFNYVNYNLNIDDLTKRKYLPLLSIFNVPFIYYTMSKFLYKVVKLSKEFPDSSIVKNKHLQGNTLEVINIPK